MANFLTGDYDAVFQISVRKINALLATMHQNRIDPAASPTFPHRTVIPIVDSPPWAGPFVNWVGNVAKLAQVSGLSAEKVMPTYYTRSLPAVSELYQKAWSDLGSVRLPDPTSGGISGTAFAQISTPTILLRTGTTSQIILQVDVRARFYPDSGTAALPEPIHGQVHAVYKARTKTVNGRKVVHVDPPASDADVNFYAASGTGLSAADVTAIVGQIRKVLHKHFVPDDVDLPDDFPISEFIALGGAGETVALPVQLAGSTATGSVNSITNDLLGGKDFALAVSKDYVNAAFAKIIQGMKDYAARLTFNVSGTFGSTVYHASVNYMTLTLKAGSMDISGKIDLTTKSVLPNGYITFTQTVVLDVDAATGVVSLKPTGDPVVDESWWLSHKTAVDSVKNGRDSALAQNAIGATFNDVRNKLSAGLQKFDKYADAQYLLGEITPDGLTVRGKIRASDRLDPIVTFSETDSGNTLTAFESWIPGGTIESFSWTWPEGAAWFSKIGAASDAHRFTVPVTAGMRSAFHICLRIDGTRVNEYGFVENVTAGKTCKPFWSEPILVTPSWMLKIMIPIWAPDPPSDRPLEDAVDGHINAAGQPNDPGGLVANTMIHFADARSSQPLATLGRIMTESKRQDASVMLILVMPRGTFRQSRRELEAKLGSMSERFRGKLILTEDYEGGWTQAFSVRETPSTYLLNARREFVWNHAGEIDVSRFAAALDEHMLPAPAAPSAPMKTQVEIGRPMPDAAFTSEEGERVALRRLRGRSFVLCFWQSWSQASLRALRGLQARMKENDLVFGINGGEDKEAIARARREQRLDFPLLEDTDATRCH